MKKTLFVISVFTLIHNLSFGQDIDWKKVEDVFGKPAVVKNDVYKFTFPRSDLKVTSGNIAIEPGLALTSWMAFKKMESEAVVMGDLVVTDSELKETEKKLIENGIDITAIHNHIISETPSIKYIHYSGQGEPTALAKKMLEVLSITGTPLGSSNQTVNTNTPDWGNVESIMGYTGTKKGNLLQFAVARADKIFEDDKEVPPQMGMATAINFQKVDSLAAVTGDFVLTADEVEPVMKSLIKNDITITALHNHMLFEKPKIFFMHFWGYANAEKLASALKEAISKTNSVKN